MRVGETVVCVWVWVDAGRWRVVEGVQGRCVGAGRCSQVKVGVLECT